MIIHLYTFVYNEEKILPFFFKHYENFINKFFIYDNHSTDNTKEIIKKRNDCQYLQFDTNNYFDEYELVSLRNSEWKKSAFDADWVIICDADEFLYYNNFKDILYKFEELTYYNYSVIKPYGYGMISKKFPSYRKPIIKQIKKGIRGISLDKPCIININKIKKTNFSFGNHFALPEGEVKLYNNNDIKLLHYKELGFKYSIERKNILRNRIPENYMKKGISKHYFIDDKKHKENFNKSLKNAIKII